MRPNVHIVVVMSLYILFIVDTCFAFLLGKPRKSRALALAFAFIEGIEYRTQSPPVRREHATEKTA